MTPLEMSQETSTGI